MVNAVSAAVPVTIPLEGNDGAFAACTICTMVTW
jgi:hypothetical protein